MEKPLCAVFDKKIGLYDNPFAVRHQGEAIREWEHLAKDQNTRFGKNPSDYDLYQIGTYNDESGRIESFTKPVHLASGVPNATTV